MGVLDRLARRLGKRREPPRKPAPRQPTLRPPVAAPEPAGPVSLPTSSTGIGLTLPASGAVLADVQTALATLNAVRGPLLINHWATWCDPCVAELPALIGLVAPHREHLTVVGLGWELFSLTPDDETGRQQVATFAEEAGVDWPTLVLTDPPETVFRDLALSVHTVPQTFLVDAEGVVVHHVPGVVEGAARVALERALGELLKQ